MTEPIIKRVNTVSIRFAEGERSKPKARYLLRDVFKLKNTDIFGVGFEGKYSIHVKFTTAQVYNEVCRLHHGNTYDVGTRERVCQVKLIDVSSYSVKVSMKNVPFELSNTQLERILNCYGTVDKIELNTNQDDWFLDTLSMERTAYMRKLNKPIPSTLLVNLTGTYIYFSYPSQIPTCNRCGSIDHSANGCPVADRSERDTYIRPDERANVFHLTYTAEEFPVLPGSDIKASSADETDKLREETEGIDSEEPPDVSHRSKAQSAPKDADDDNDDDSIITQENHTNATNPPTTPATGKSQPTDVTQPGKDNASTKGSSLSGIKTKTKSKTDITIWPDPSLSPLCRSHVQYVAASSRNHTDV